MKEQGRRRWRIKLTWNDDSGKYTTLRNIDYWPELDRTTTLKRCLEEFAMWQQKGWITGHWRFEFENKQTGESFYGDIL